MQWKRLNSESFMKLLTQTLIYGTIYWYSNSNAVNCHGHAHRYVFFSRLFFIWFNISSLAKLMICLFSVSSLTGMSTLSTTRWKASLCYMWNFWEPLDLFDLWFVRMWKVIIMGFRYFILRPRTSIIMWVSLVLLLCIDVKLSHYVVLFIQIRTRSC